MRYFPCTELETYRKRVKVYTNTNATLTKGKSIMAKLLGWAFERNAKGEPTHLLARLPIEENGKTSKGATRFYSSGGFLNVENERDDKLVVSCTAFQGKK